MLGCIDIAGCIASSAGCIAMVCCIDVAECIDSCMTGCIDSRVNGCTAPDTKAKAADGDSMGVAIWASADITAGCIMGAVGVMLSACITPVVVVGAVRRRDCAGSSQTDGCGAVAGAAIIAAGIIAIGGSVGAMLIAGSLCAIALAGWVSSIIIACCTSAIIASGCIIIACIAARSSGVAAVAAIA